MGNCRSFYSNFGTLVLQNGGQCGRLGGDMKFLITAGPTREALDPVRYLTNRSSGRMGYALAGAARHEGHEVILISGPTTLDVPAGVDFIPVESAQQMYDAVRDMVKYAGAAITQASLRSQFFMLVILP